MDGTTIQIVSVVAIIGFLWSLHREIGGLRKEIADLRERVGRVEGLLQGFLGRPQEPQT